MSETLSIPDIGTTSPVDVIEVLVQPGDDIQEEQSILTLETEKASMEVPAAKAGKVKAIHVKVGDKVKQGDVILDLEGVAEPVKAKAPLKEEEAVTVITSSAPAPTPAPVRTNGVVASPAVRRLSRELNIDLTHIQGTGRRGRITTSDILAMVNQQGRGTGAMGFDLLPWPSVDFSEFGPVESVPLNKIKRATAANLHRNWVRIPHVTQFDKADITELEAFRQHHRAHAKSQGIALTVLALILPALVRTLKRFPEFNAALSEDGHSLILRRYYHIGIAVDTPQGLVVPVLRDVDQKDVLTLAKEMGTLSKKAREGQLTPKDMQGGTFTISSLGGIGGSAFTPIINAPEVAILGLSRAAIEPLYREGQWVPRRMLPLALSYDHRVIDGAQACRFTQALSQQLSLSWLDSNVESSS